MQKEKVTVVLSAEICGELDAMADRFGLTKNAIIAAAAYELSRVPAENLWHALARIGEGESLVLNDSARPKISSASVPKKIANLENVS